MGSLKVYATVAGFLALASSVSAVRAADLLPPPPPPPMPVEPVSDIGGGWYLRGDVGVSKYNVGKASHTQLPNATFYGEEVGSGAFAGAGIGYQFNSWFRADVTGEYRFSTGMKFRDKEYFSDGVNQINGNEFYKSNLSSGVFLLNGYFDLGNWYGVTPFIGAGVGYAYNNVSGFEHSTMNFYPTALGLNPGINGGYARDKGNGNLAWALHAGLAMDITPNLKLELAYRYLNLGEARTGDVYCYCNSTTVRPGFKIKDIEAHDVKIGLRWAFGGPAIAPAMEPAPLMRKY